MCINTGKEVFKGDLSKCINIEKGVPQKGPHRCVSILEMGCPKKGFVDMHQ